MTESVSNASPPTNEYDFDIGRVEMRVKYFTALGKPCQYINILDEDAFLTCSGSEETELSSDESISSKDSAVRSISIPPISSNVHKVKEEKLSDSEDTLKPKSSKQASSKTKKYPVVEYTDSDDSGGDKSKSHHKKHSKDSIDNRSKARRKKHSGDPDEDRRKSRRQKYSDDSDDDRHRSYRKDYSSKIIKKEEVEEREFKHTPGLTAAFGSFHCRVCDIVVNSEITYQTHLRGRKHNKALKAQAVPALVIQSLNEPRIPTRIAPSVVSAPTTPIKKSKRVRLNVESLIQRIADDYKDGPLPGLENVVEIRPPVEGVRDISYVCELCEAQCVPNSIMKHLTGFKHYLRCLEKIDARSYERYRYTSKKIIEGKVMRILCDYEKYNGRGRICVEKEVAEEYARWDEPGPSWRDYPPQPSAAPNNDDDDGQCVSSVEHLDTSMSDFYCRACDAHMNNQSMWEAHVRGKRHLKNIKKVPGESTSKIKSVQCTGETAHLMRILNELDDKDEYGNDIVICGLGYIKETQGEGGDLYNCYLCGACTSTYDVIDHLNQVKHKIKFLEEMNAKGNTNSIDQIKSFSGFSAYSKECMINDEVRNTLAQYGDGKVAVYKSKDMFPSSFSSRP